MRAQERRMNPPRMGASHGNSLLPMRIVTNATLTATRMCAARWWGGAARQTGIALLAVLRHPPSASLPARHASTATSSTSGSLHFCVVGAGPAGFYTTDRLLKRFGQRASVSLLDRLPTPFGLVRSGVAPDHQDTKNVINQFRSLGRDPRVSFFGNVRVGKDVSLQELRALFHAVVLATGAETDRRLGVPGEEGPDVFTAREFVWWYNGHPDAAALPVDLSKVTSVAICGIGNVALDCARVLLRNPHKPPLATSDIAGHALSALRQAWPNIRHVHLVARRGPVQAACTPKELKELATEPGLLAHAPAAQMMVSEMDQAVMKATRTRRRVFEIITQAAAASAKAESDEQATSSPDAPPRRHLHFQFYRQPRQVVRDAASGQVTGLEVERTSLQLSPSGTATAVGTGVFEVIPAQMVLVSIGYQALPVPGAPFNAVKGVVPHDRGRVPTPQPGLYVCGWVKRGPTGIIGTNLADAEDTVGSIVQDVADGTLAGQGSAAVLGADGLHLLLAQRILRYVDFPRWERIDAAEVEAGRAAGKAREKILRVEDMLTAAGLNACPRFH